MAEGSNWREQTCLSEGWKWRSKWSLQDKEHPPGYFLVFDEEICPGRV